MKLLTTSVLLASIFIVGCKQPDPVIPFYEYKGYSYPEYVKWNESGVHCGIHLSSRESVKSLRAIYYKQEPQFSDHDTYLKTFWFVSSSSFYQCMYGERWDQGLPIQEMADIDFEMDWCDLAKADPTKDQKVVDKYCKQYEGCTFNEI